MIHIIEVKEEVIEEALKGSTTYKKETILEALKRLNKLIFDTNNGNLYNGSNLIEQYVIKSHYKKEEARAEAIHTFKRWTRNEASKILRGY